MPLLSQINLLGQANNILLTVSMAFGGSVWSSLALFERNSKTASYHAFALLWGSVLPSARTEQSDDSENSHTVGEGERTYGINSVLLIEVGRHPELLLCTDAWSTLPAQRINNKLLVDAYSFGLGFASDGADAMSQARVQLHIAQVLTAWREAWGHPCQGPGKSHRPLSDTPMGQCLPVNKWARSGKKLYLPVPDFTYQGWLLIWECLSPFSFLTVFSQGDSTHIPYPELSMDKTELLTFKPLQVILVQKQLLKKGIRFKITFFLCLKKEVSHFLSNLKKMYLLTENIQ